MKKILSSLLVSTFVLLTLSLDIVALPQIAHAIDSATVVPTALATTTATLAITLTDSSGDPSPVNFSYGVSETYQDKFKLPVYDSSSGAYLVNLTHLGPGTKYYYVITSRDNPTEVVPGGTGDFTTVDPFGGGLNGSSTPPVTISDFSASSNSDGSAVVFTATASGVPTNTDFMYSLACGLSDSTINKPSASYDIPLGTVTNTIALSNTLTINPPYPYITSSAPYYCQIFDVTGRSVSNIVRITYESGQLDSSYISILGGTKVTAQIHLSTTPSDAPVIDWGTSDTDLSGSLPVDMDLVASGTNLYSGQITGLKRNTTYYYEVFDHDNTTPYDSDVKTFTTTNDQDTPPVLQTISGDIPTIDTSAYSSGGLVTCGREPGNVSNKCDFNALMSMINKFIGFLIFIIAPAIAAVFMSMGGFMYMTSVGNAEKAGKGKDMIVNAFIGWLLAFAAWIIVKFVMTSLGYNSDGSWLTFW